MREIKVCEVDGERFISYHKSDRFCCTRCRNEYWNRERQKAVLAMKLMDDSERARFASKLDDVKDWLKGLQPEKMQLTHRQAERVVELHSTKAVPSFVGKPTQIEPRPDFTPAHQTTWPEEWQCVKCDKRWPIATLYCDCEPQPISSESDF